MCSINSEYILCNALNIPLMKFVENLYNIDFLCYSVSNNVLYVYSKFLCPGGVSRPWFDVIDQGQDHIIKIWLLPKKTCRGNYSKT